MIAISTPSGRWTIVGFGIPTSLVTDDPDVQRVLALCGPGLARKVADRKGIQFTTSYATQGEALDAIRSVSA